MLKEHRDGVSDHSRRLWTVLSFMIWHGIFVETASIHRSSSATTP